MCENELPGTPQSTWDITATDGTTIAGFADPFSANIGQSINFKIESAATYKIDIYRMGYYQGDGARLITSLTPNVSVSESQPSCNTNTTIGLVDCGDWGVSATWAIPTTVVSGVYFARIYSSSDANLIPFVVTNNASTSAIIYSTSDETWQAYNDWGGYSLYVGTATGSPWCCSALDPGRATQVSYNRPFADRSDDQEDYLWYAEFPMIEWLEENGYDVTYVSQSDYSGSGGAALLEQHKIFMTAGHTEYIDAGDRAAMTAARNAGVNLAFFSGNLMWWKTRWAASQYGNEAYRTLITYKESLDSAQTDPADPPTWTGSWRDPRFVASGDDSDQPENALTGQLWTVNCCSYADQVPYQYAQDAIWRNTAIANLTSGQTYTMPAQTLGYEWDSDVDNGLRPAGEIDMSQTCEDVSQALLTQDEQIGPAEECNSLTLYRAASGALVFDTGTVQWSWGLFAGDHDGTDVPVDKNMQQATVNLLAMMNVQPATLQAGLVAGVAPDYTAPPTSTITAPAAGTAIASGSTVTISGTATDSGGGVVAGVEVSTDGGSTWHPVTTMSPDATSVTWSYTWSAAGLGTVTIESRATDDDANTGTPGPGVAVTVSCPCGLFGTNYVPSTTATTDPTTYELGVRFESSVAGWVTGVRFYKGAGNNGTHTGSLWSASGQLLASGTFEGETATGWQTLQFATPVPIAANTVYVASYYDPDGHYAQELNKLAYPLSNPPLTALGTNLVTPGQGNGVYFVGGPGFPTESYESSSYAVDPIFTATQPSGPAVPASTSAAPAVLADSNGELALYAVRADGNVWSDVQLTPGGAFSGWLPLSTSGNFTGTPGVIQTASGIIGIYARTTAGAIMGASESALGGEDLSWIQIGSASNLASGPTALLTKAGVIALYGVTTGGVMDGISQAKANGAFGSWQALSGSLGFTGRPAVLQTTSGVIAIYARTSAGAIDGASQSVVGGSFGSFGAIGTATLASDPMALQTSSGTIALYAADSSGDVEGASQSVSGGAFGAWSAISGSQGFTGRPAVLQNSSGITSLYDITSVGTVLTASQATAGGAFGSWSQVGTASDLISEPAAVFTTSGLIAIFASDSTGGVSWSSQATVGGAFGTWAES